MPQLLEYIDAIARKKKRDVLYLIFHRKNNGVEIVEDDSWLNYDFRKDTRRKQVLKWFDAHGVPWQKCGPVARENGFDSYLGEVYIDVPFDENDQQYCKVRDYLENPDGSMRFKSVMFCYLPLEHAMRNAHHDEPGFWEKWAEDF